MEKLSLAIEKGPDEEGELVHSIVDLLQQLDDHWATYEALHKRSLHQEKQAHIDILMATYEQFVQLISKIDLDPDTFLQTRINDPERRTLLLDKIDFELTFYRHHIHKVLK